MLNQEDDTLLMDILIADMNSLSFASSLLRPSTCKQPPLFHRLRVHSSFLHWYSHNQCHNPYYSDGFSSIQFHLPNTHHT
ncbi:putative phosphoenolpyruvate synthase regulatory protein [Bienertia sinuspersici]